jgi:hypothetical protein
LYSIPSPFVARVKDPASESELAEQRRAEAYVDGLVDVAALHAELAARKRDAEAAASKPRGLLGTALYAFVATVGLTYLGLTLVNHWDMTKGLAIGLLPAATAFTDLGKRRPPRRVLMAGIAVGAAAGLLLMLWR